jgi:beta-galactosidase
MVTLGDKQLFQFGAVYFRKSNPPPEDWERDYRVAAEDGHTLFRHWVIRNQIEIAPGVFDWADYDRHMDLAAKNGIRVVLAEMVNDTPDWYVRSMDHARGENRRGEKRTNEMNGSSVSPNGPLCLDHPEVLASGTRFLAELACRYRNHPALFAYDIWNECTFYDADRMCFCPATQERFRDWLKERYQGDLRALAKRWHRNSLLEWEDVHLPRQVGPYPEAMDAIRFFNDNAIRLMEWRRAVLKKHDSEHLVVAHGNARSFADIAPCCGDDHRAAEHADIFGYTYYYGNRCHPFLAGDLIRSASRGKEFWRAEAVGNSDWAHRQLGRPAPKHDEMAEPENIRLDVLISMACGASAFQNPRWRPLLDGPLFGAFGWYGMDGSRTPRSALIAELAVWAKKPEVLPLWQARPLPGEVGILLLEEAQAQCYGLYANTDACSLSLQGAYQAFLDSSVQCDIIRLADIERYNLLYLPYPVAMGSETIAALRDWVERGGCLVAEGCPGYFDEFAHAFPSQPSRGLDELFGCRESSVSFGLDGMDGLKIQRESGEIDAGVYRQSYQLTSGKAAGWYADGSIAIVDHVYGKGKTCLVGSMPGYGYKRQPELTTRLWFESLLSIVDQTPRSSLGHENVVARLWQNQEDWFVWVVNQGESAVQTTLRLAPPLLNTKAVQVIRGKSTDVRIEDGQYALFVPSRDALIMRITPKIQ